MASDVKREWFETDYYSVLGIAETATDKEITKAYRKLARKYHPDANPGDAAAEDRFKQVSAAYEVIGDESRREQYDQVRRMGPLGGAFGANGRDGVSFDFDGAGDLSDLLGSVFGGGLFGTGAGATRGSARAQRGYDQETRLAISFEDALRGITTSLSVTDNSGQRSIRVRIPAGVEDGQRIRLRGKGGPGQPPGDLFVVVSVRKHRIFGRSGSKLTLDLPVTFAEAALGAEVRVPTFEGDTVTVKIPAGTRHGATLRVRGAGAEIDGNHGDLLVVVDIAIPQNLSASQKKALQKFASLSTESPRDRFELK